MCQRGLDVNSFNKEMNKSKNQVGQGGNKLKGHLNCLSSPTLPVLLAAILDYNIVEDQWNSVFAMGYM